MADMTTLPPQSQAAAAAALADWNAGRHSAAIDRLDAAARAGDEAALGLLVQLSGHEPDRAGTRARAAAAMAAMPSSMMRNRHHAYFRAAGLAAPADWAGALRERHDQAEAGDWLARTELGLLALIAGADRAGLAWLEQAAGDGSGHATAALLRLGLDSGTLSPLAREKGPGLARSGHPMAPALVQASGALPVAGQTVAASGEVIDTTEVLARITAAMTDCGPADQRLSDTPRIERWNRVLPSAVCDYLTVAAAPLLKPAEVHDPATGQMIRDPYRTSLTAALTEQAMDLVSLAVKSRMAALAGRPVDTAEALAVLVYRLGEEYKAHFDFILEVPGQDQAELATRGQRVATSLVRLNAEFQGGETRFPKLDISWTGGPGSGLSFDNVDASGACDKATLHTGEPVREGVKVIASLWLRERAG